MPVQQLPVLLVHGLWDSLTRIDPLVQGLRARGIERVVGFDLQPSSGRVPITELARQVAAQADALRRESGAQQIDLLGFSMGALAARCYLQQGGGRDHVRRFISISGPHAGTLTAFALPFAGMRDMRPQSALLRALEAEADPFGTVEVHCIYTPLDLMIVPATSSILRGAHSIHRVPIPLHRWMIRDPRVLDLVAGLLTRA
jgi:triacylglycerol esterase/lipase EstA (alpha/beta hydrolase family)